MRARPLLGLASKLASLAGAGLLLVALRAECRFHAPSRLDSLLVPAAVPAWAVRLFALGFESAAADVSYLQSIQIFGERLPAGTPLDERVRRGEAIARLLERTTDLDPEFAYAYLVGAFAIPVATDTGVMRNLPATESLLRKGIAAVKHDWRIPFHLAYLKTAQEAEFGEAARIMAEAARRPGRPDFIPLLATRLAAQGGTIEVGIDVARARLALASDEDERAEIQARLDLLVMEQRLRILEEAVERFRLARGGPPPGLGALVSAGFLDTLPDEPHGGEWLLDPDGTVRSTGAARLRLNWNAMSEIEAVQNARPTPTEQDGTGPSDAGTSPPPPRLDGGPSASPGDAP